MNNHNIKPVVFDGSDLNKIRYTFLENIYHVIMENGELEGEKKVSDYERYMEITANYMSVNAMTIIPHRNHVSDGAGLLVQMQ